jgi:Sigma-70, region 4
VRAESVSIALLVVLETLTPLERAVFVLHEVFGYAHTEIAGILDRNPSAIRQLAQALAPDVTMWADGGGMARAAGTHPVQGRDKVACLIVGDAFRHPIPDLSIRYRRVNGEPAGLLLSGSNPLPARIPRPHPRRRPGTRHIRHHQPRQAVPPRLSADRIPGRLAMAPGGRRPRWPVSLND